MTPTIPVIGRQFWRITSLLLAVGLGWGDAVQLSRAESTILTNATDIRSLSAAEAAEGRPVSLRAVLVDTSEPRGRAIIVADESAAIYCTAESSLLGQFNRGDLLKLTGVTDPGQFAPIVKLTKATKLGTAPLPEPQPTTYQEIISGALDAQWVEVSGVIQQYLPAAPGSDIRRILLSLGGNVVHVRLTDPHNPGLKEDARIRVRALCFYQFNQKRQLLNAVLQVPAGAPIIIEKAAPEHPYDAPVRPAASLLVFSPDNSQGHRVHMRGVVLHAQSQSTIWIRDDSAGLRLQTHTGAPVRPGDILDVLGFSKYGTATPVIEGAVYRVLGHTNPPAALPVNAVTNAFDFVDNLIAVEADLTVIEPIVDGLLLSLEADGIGFRALLKQPQDARLQPFWQAGSRVRVEGICSVSYDENRPLMGIWHPQSFQLLLRSPADLTILRAPSWWTLTHVVYLLAIAAGTLFVAVGSITLLARNRLREQKQQRAMAEAEFTAILAERNRVAREIHDTLAQGLTATSVHLRLARRHAREAKEEVTRHIDTAQDLVRGSLQEARNTIWNMRPQVLETGDLPTALKNILHQMADGTDLKVHFAVTGHPRRLAPVIENNVLRLGQEAITNATRHAHARNIWVTLDFNDRQFRLGVRDDGKGFDVNQPPASEGGFGLVGMRGRAKELKGEFTIQSTPQTGTQLELIVPLRGD